MTPLMPSIRRRGVPSPQRSWRFALIGVAMVALTTVALWALVSLLAAVPVSAPAFDAGVPPDALVVPDARPDAQQQPSLPPRMPLDVDAGVPPDARIDVRPRGRRSAGGWQPSRTYRRPDAPSGAVSAAAEGSSTLCRIPAHTIVTLRRITVVESFGSRYLSYVSVHPLCRHTLSLHVEQDPSGLLTINQITLGSLSVCVAIPTTVLEPVAQHVYWIFPDPTELNPCTTKPLSKRSRTARQPRQRLSPAAKESDGISRPTWRTR